MAARLPMPARLRAALSSPFVEGITFPIYFTGAKACGAAFHHLFTEPATGVGAAVRGEFVRILSMNPGNALVRSIVGCDGHTTAVDVYDPINLMDPRVYSARSLAGQEADGSQHVQKAMSLSSKAREIAPAVGGDVPALVSGRSLVVASGTTLLTAAAPTGYCGGSNVTTGNVAQTAGALAVNVLLRVPAASLAETLSILRTALSRQTARLSSRTSPIRPTQFVDTQLLIYNCTGANVSYTSQSLWTGVSSLDYAFGTTLVSAFTSSSQYADTFAHIDSRQLYTEKTAVQGNVAYFASNALARSTNIVGVLVVAAIGVAALALLCCACVCWRYSLLCARLRAWYAGEEAPTSTAGPSGKQTICVGSTGSAPSAGGLVDYRARERTMSEHDAAEAVATAGSTDEPEVPASGSEVVGGTDGMEPPTYAAHQQAVYVDGQEHTPPVVYYRPEAAAHGAVVATDATAAPPAYNAAQSSAHTASPLAQFTHSPADPASVPRHAYAPAVYVGSSAPSPSTSAPVTDSGPGRHHHRSSSGAAGVTPAMLRLRRLSQGPLSSSPAGSASPAAGAFPPTASTAAARAHAHAADSPSMPPSSHEPSSAAALPSVVSITAAGDGNVVIVSSAPTNEVAANAPSASPVIVIAAAP